MSHIRETIESVTIERPDFIEDTDAPSPSWKLIVARRVRLWWSAMRPSFFAECEIRGAQLEDIRTVYIEWLLGIGAFGKQRDRRIASGVRPTWSAANIAERSSLIGTHDCRIESRSNERAFLARWIHRDDEDGGILWHNLVNVEHQTDWIRVEHSIVRTAPRGTVVKPRASAPTIVGFLVKKYGSAVAPKELTQKLVSQVAADEILAFVDYVLLDRSRRLPILLVTPTRNGEFTADVSELARLLGGMAAVVALKDVDATWALRRVLESKGFRREFGCYDGGIRLYESNLNRDDSPYQHQLWLRPIQFQSTDSRPRTPTLAGEIAERVVARTMRTGFLNAVEDFDAREQRRATEAALARKLDLESSFGSFAKRIDELEGRLQDSLQFQDMFQAEIDQLRREKSEAEEARARAEGHAQYAEHLKDEIESLKHQRAAGALPDDARRALVAALAGQASPEQSLLAIATLFPDRIVVLDTAIRSAKKAESFNERDTAFRLLFTLATEYWSALIGGGGDAKARTVFGKSYASGESESAESNKRARALRTFTYKDKEIEMFQHLKIGRKESKHDCMRVYFAWDAPSRRLIIGHCGAHLDLR